MDKVLIADDNEEILSMLNLYFKNSNFDVVLAKDGKEVLEKLDDTIDLILLDIMMPNLDGKETLIEIRKTNNVPVMFVTAKISNHEKFEGLMIGADDYVIKPFDPNDVITRAKVLIRRYKVLGSKNQEQIDDKNLIEIKDVVINISERTVSKKGELVKLTKTEFNLLLVLSRNRGIVFTPERLNELAFDDEEYYLSNNSLSVHIKNMRYKLEDNKNDKFVTNVWGVGYKIEK